MLKSQLNDAQPVFYAGETEYGDGVHAFVCDGWEENFWGAKFHFNWGWLGEGDGWFRVNEHTYSEYQKAIINLNNSIDCNSTIFVEQWMKNNSYLSHYYYKPSEGNIITIPNIIIEPGEIVNYSAYKKINLNPGFLIQHGASFKARIINCPLNCNLDSYNSKELNIETNNNLNALEVPDYLASSNVSLSPNPGNGIFVLSAKCSSMCKFSYIIYNSQGETVIPLEYAESTNSINISNYPTGIYIVIVNLMDEVIKLIYIKQ